MAAAIVGLMLAGPSGAAGKELQWRRGQTPGASATAAFNSSHRRDHAVRQAAFEDDEVLQLNAQHSGADSAAGQARLRSVVVNRDALPGADRSAQLPWESSQPGGEGSRYEDSQLEEQLRSPFVDEPADEQQPPVTPPDLPTDSTSPDNSLEYDPFPQDDRLQFNGTGRQPAGPPRTFQAAPETAPRTIPRPPSTSAPTTAPSPPVSGGAANGVREQERRQAQSLCEQELAAVRDHRLSRVDLNIAVSGIEGEDYPYDCQLDDGSWTSGRSWPQITYLWKASALCHKPLYFENEALERYGHSCAPCLQPLASGAHFFTRLPVLPYCMGVEPPHECIYALGHYRPGSCAPYMVDPVPISLRGALFQAGAVVGAAAVLP